MKNIRLLLIGVFFGITLIKSEVVSWYRIQEMFRFDSFHMYGVIASAVVLSAAIIYLIKLTKFKDTENQPIQIADKPKNHKASLFGGIIFGLGWALTGACPGPIYALVGGGYPVFLVVLLSAIFGAFLYGLTRKYLPH